MLKIQLEELETFVAVAKSGNFSNAADVLNITSSVVSRTIKKLEQKLQTTLFNRTTRKVIITQEGVWLLKNANEILEKTNNIENYLGEKGRHPSGRLVIDGAAPFILHAISPLIANFNELYPDISLVMHSNESNIDLIDRKVDVAIRIGELEDSTLKARKLGECFRRIYASPGYILNKGSPINSSQLDKHTCLGFIKPEKLNTWPVSNDDEKMIKIIPNIVADNGETLRQLAINDCGIACLSSFTVKEDVAEGRLVPLLDQQIINHPIPIYAVFYSDNAINKRLHCFLDFISKHISLY